MFEHYPFYPGFHQRASLPSGFSGFWGSFFGAFFAFIFGLIAYRITKRLERFAENRNALVRLERVLSRHLNDFYTLQEIVNSTLNILGPKLTSNRLFSPKVPEDIDLHLGSIEVINKLFNYQVMLDRLGINISNINYALTRMEDVLIGGQPLPQENIESTKKRLIKLRDNLPDFDKELKELLFLVKVNLEKVQKSSFFTRVYNSVGNFDNPVNTTNNFNND